MELLESRAKSIVVALLGLLLLSLPGAVDAAVGCDCPTDDLAGFPIGQSSAGANLFCSYPAFPGEDPNDFFCSYDASSGALLADHDAGFCPASAASCDAPTCGDNVVGVGESCDGANLNGASCSDLGFTSGTLACDDQCAFDTSACYHCGDNVADPGEACDGSDLNGASCSDVGAFTGGTLACTGQCTYDTSACTSGICGDNVANASEACDGSDLRGASCTSLGLASGTLACNAQCTYDVSGCHTCGDNVASVGETCDGSDLRGASCTSMGFASGTLACDNQCALDTSACVPSGVCGDGVVNGAGEQCDDGSGNNGTAGSCCSPGCQAQNCSVGAGKDSIVRTNHPDINEGANTILAVRNHGKDRSVVAFDLSGADSADVSKATLVLTIRRNLGTWGPLGRLIQAFALNKDFSEGNGKILRQSSPTHGSGPGVTNACSTDADISNLLSDCSGADVWNGSDVAAAASDSATITNDSAGELSFEVTADVKSGKSGWLLNVAKVRRPGGVLFYSREGADAVSNAGLAPRLLLEY